MKKITDPGTYGGFKQSKIVAAVLNECDDEKQKHKVGVIVNRFTERLKSLDKLGFNWEYFVTYLVKETKKTIWKADLNHVIKTHLLGVINAFYIQKLNERKNDKTITLKFKLKMDLNDKLVKGRVFQPKRIKETVQYLDGEEFKSISFTDENYFEQL